MSVALYATIWAALALLVAGEAGARARSAAGARRAALASLAGAMLAAAHVAVALHARHGWSLAHAREDIRRQTEEVFGLSFGGGVWVNFAFVGLWLADAAWRLADARGHARRPRVAAWALRAFQLIVVASGAVLFASPAGRIAGVPLVTALLWAWRPAPAHAAERGALVDP